LWRAASPLPVYFKLLVQKVETALQAVKDDLQAALELASAAREAKALKKAEEKAKAEEEMERLKQERDDQLASQLLTITTCLSTALEKRVTIQQLIRSKLVRYLMKTYDSLL
jgi:restriction endonuclease Mrr